MKVAVVYHFDPSDDGKGGVVRYLNNLLQNLLKESIDLTLIGAQFTEQETKYENLNYIPILKNSNVWWKYLLMLFLKLPSLKLSNNTIIHVHRIEYILPFLIFCKKNPLVYTIHGERLATAKNEYSPYLYLFIDNLYYIYEKIVFSKIDKMLPVSNRVKESFEKVHPNISQKMKVIPVGAKLSEFASGDKQQMRIKYGFSNDDLLILYAGILEKRKNLDFLINSFSILHSKIQNSKLLIVGDGPERKLLQDLVSVKGLLGNVIFFGEVTREKLVSIFMCADLYTLTSFSEGSPTVIKEALASGIPVVSTDVGDVKEIINSKYLGKVVKGYDIKEFSDAMLETIELVESDKDFICNKCKKCAQKYDLDIIMKEIIYVFEECSNKLS